MPTCWLLCDKPYFIALKCEYKLLIVIITTKQNNDAFPIITWSTHISLLCYKTEKIIIFALLGTSWQPITGMTLLTALFQQCASCGSLEHFHISTDTKVSKQGRQPLNNCADIMNTKLTFDTIFPPLRISKLKPQSQILLRDTYPLKPVLN